MVLAQPLGAETLALNVTVSGAVKDGGTIKFAANDLKPTHPTKPLVVAQTLRTALTEGATYEAVLAERAGDAVTPRATFALRVVRRRAGDAAILYRRRLTPSGQERLDRIAQLGLLAFSAGSALLRAAVRNNGELSVKLSMGLFHPLDPDWWVRAACYALVAKGLRDTDRLHRAATNLQHADETEAAWRLGLMARPNGTRAIRALRILVEAVK